MAIPSLLRSSIRSNRYVCGRCALQISRTFSNTPRRLIGVKYLVKIADAEDRWAQKAVRIRNGEEQSMLSLLEERGLVQKVTGNRDAVDKLLTDKRIGAYVGVDPTAPSIHVGNLVAFMPLFWMYIKGYHTVALLGGATAKIGDPTGRLTSREEEKGSVRTANMTRMHYQLKQLWQNIEKYGSKYGWERDWASHRELVNNNAWWNSLPLLQVLQLLGPGVRIGSMLARDTVKNKMSKGDGMSFAEFTYPLMQAWDWWYMFQTKGINMQIGGSDQYGNITAGIDAIKYIVAHHPDPAVRELVGSMDGPVGLTVPLLTTSSGEKFGKSAGNAVWLDKDETSSFDLYAYFLKTADADVGKFLKLFTFMPTADIDKLVAQHMEAPQDRLAQHKLAREFTEMVHGAHDAKVAAEQHRTLFKNPLANINLLSTPDSDAEAGIVTLNNKPKAHIRLPKSLIYQKSMAKILKACKLSEGSAEGHRLAEAGGVYIGSTPDHKKTEPMPDGYVSWQAVKMWKPEETRKYLIHDNILLLRRAKNNIRVIEVVSDEEYALSGEKYRGMSRDWADDVLRAREVKMEVLAKEKADLKELLAGEKDSVKAILDADISWQDVLQEKGFDAQDRAEVGLKRKTVELKSSDEVFRKVEANWTPSTPAYKMRVPKGTY